MNKIDELLNQLNENADALMFQHIMAVIDEHYDFSPSAFTNGDITNAAGENNGSCKVFAFGLMHSLTEQQTLALFAEHYRSVLALPRGSEHQNIRNFMTHGWSGIKFEAEPLVARR